MAGNLSVGKQSRWQSRFRVAQANQSLHGWVHLKAADINYVQLTEMKQSSKLQKATSGSNRTQQNEALTL